MTKQALSWYCFKCGAEGRGPKPTNRKCPECGAGPGRTFSELLGESDITMRKEWEFDPEEQDNGVLHTDALLPQIKLDRESGPHGFLVNILEGHFSLEEKKNEEPETDESRMIDALQSLHGVEQFAIRGYSIFIQKGRVFSWDEIKPRVESVISDFC